MIRHSRAFWPAFLHTISTGFEKIIECRSRRRCVHVVKNLEVNGVPLDVLRAISLKSEPLVPSHLIP